MAEIRGDDQEEKGFEEMVVDFMDDKYLDGLAKDWGEKLKAGQLESTPPKSCLRTAQGSDRTQS